MAEDSKHSGKEELKFPPPKYKWGEIKEHEIKSITLPSGQKYEVVEFDGVTFPVRFVKMGIMPDFRESIPLIRQMPIRDDDVLICAYPKAGTHWVWEITKMLTKGKAEYDALPKETAMLEFHFPEEFESMASPRVLNTHFPFRLIPKQIVDKKCKIIFIQRNPKDVAVSAFCHTNVMSFGKGPTFDDVVRTFGFSSTMANWYEYTLDWEQVLAENKDLNVHSMYYEDLKRDPINEIKKMADFLGVQAEDKLVKEIAEKCNFKNLKTANSDKKGFHGDEESKGMSNALYRKGEIGDWKNWFTVDQNEFFDSVYEEKMKNSKLKFTYT